MSERIQHRANPGIDLADAAERLDPHRDGRDAWSGAIGNIETASGQRYDFRNPDPNTVTLEDIAHALSNVCRFAGHVRRFTSVAEHSVLVSRIVEARLWEMSQEEREEKGVRNVHYWTVAGLLHDSHEAYVWDAPSPVKPLLGDVFKELSSIADKVIVAKFLQPFLERPPIRDATADYTDFKNPIIKKADRIALVVEGRALLPVGPTDDEWEPLPVGVPWAGGMAPEDAKRLFLERARELGL